MHAWVLGCEHICKTFRPNAHQTHLGAQQAMPQSGRRLYMSQDHGDISDEHALVQAVLETYTAALSALLNLSTMRSNQVRIRAS